MNVNIHMDGIDNAYLTLRCVLDFAILIPGAVFSFLPFCTYLKNKSKFSLFTTAITFLFLIIAGISISRIYFILPRLIMIPLLLILFTLYIFIVDDSTGRKLFCFFNAYMLCVFCRLYTLFIMAPYETENKIWQSSGLFTVKSGVVCLALALITGFIFFKTLYVKIPMLMNQEYISSVWDFLFIAPMMMTVLMGWSIPIHPDLAMAGRLRPAALIFLALIMLVMLLLYHVFWWTADKLTEGAKLQNENMLLMMEGKRYHELRAYMDDTRTIRHDFRQHILVITQLAGSGRNDELMKYLEQFTETSSGYTGYCANAYVDAIASYYKSFAEGQKTEIDWHLNLPSKLPINETEYCALLGNLVENALNAVKKIPESRRKVRIISSMMSDTMIGISADNPFDGKNSKLKFGRNGLPVSMKERHGIGLTSIYSTVKRYNGSMKIRTENNIFSVDIILHCND